MPRDEFHSLRRLALLFLLPLRLLLGMLLLSRACLPTLAHPAAVPAPPLGTIGTPTNFWLLRQRGVVAADEDRLVIEYLSSLRAGDASAAAGRV